MPTLGDVGATRWQESQNYARPSLPEDADFLYGVYETTARHLVEDGGLRWPEGRMRDKCKSDAASGKTQILMAGDVRVGFFSLEERADEVWLDALFILPEHQRRGIGTHLVADALSKARRVGVPVRCLVMEFNPGAMAFYKQFGFIEYKVGKRCVYLESTTHKEG